MIATGSVPRIATSGIDPKSITKVIFTQSLQITLGNTTTTDGNVHFPNEHYCIRPAERDFWTDPD